MLPRVRDISVDRLRPVLPAPALNPPGSAPRPGTPAGGGEFCLSAAPPTVSNNVAVVMSELSSPTTRQPPLPDDGGWAAAEFAVTCDQAMPMVIGVATERDAVTEAPAQPEPERDPGTATPPELSLARRHATVSAGESERLLAEHRDWWAEYWARSSLEIPSEPAEFAIVQEW